MTMIHKAVDSLIEDPSIGVLLAANAITAYLAISEGWGIIGILWAFCLQSCIIGFFAIVRAIRLKHFTTEGNYLGTKQLEPTEETRWISIIYFLMGYGIFHAAIILFLAGGRAEFTYGKVPTDNEMRGIFLAAMIYFANHLFSAIYHRKESEVRQNIGHVMAYPFIRILPIYALFVTASFISWPIPFFLFMKAVADIMMHNMEHRLFSESH